MSAAPSLPALEGALRVLLTPPGSLRPASSVARREAALTLGELIPHESSAADLLRALPEGSRFVAEVRTGGGAAYFFEAVLRHCAEGAAGAHKVQALLAYIVREHTLAHAAHEHAAELEACRD